MKIIWRQYQSIFGMKALQDGTKHAVDGSDIFSGHQLSVHLQSEYKGPEKVSIYNDAQYKLL